jgi:hypothetical protein
MFFLQRQTPRLCRPRLPCRDSPEADSVIITIESHRALVDPVDDSIAIVACFIRHSGRAMRWWLLISAVAATALAFAHQRISGSA